ncbi:uncharacterized protein DEA37_0008055 [Paragonimus westermani]|uniref:Uncharacterized protein n=1 Tax=Paragonimus westermani TaxID=34504 RepID=A0A5J4NEK6_9TREM|nr:uncharacterized protein DEA37_0008055 [Paragonimus westermani]
MCDFDLYKRTKLYIPMLILGISLIVLSCFVIAIGIARAREDVWIAGILVATVAGPLFLFSLCLFCVIRTDRGPMIYRKQYVLGRIPPPEFTSIPSNFGTAYQPSYLQQRPSVVA